MRPSEDPRPRAVEVQITPDSSDLVAGLLWGTGITALTEETSTDGRVVLRVDVPPGGVDVIRAAVGHLADEVTEVEVDDGLDEWREHATVAWVGRRLVVHPAWLPLGEVEPGSVVVELEPGRAWGHGAHPTTRLCLAEVERLVDDIGVGSLLDVGCGSGTLAVAAALLGVETVVACDIDPEAVASTAANAERNGLGHRVEVRLVPATDDEPSSDPLATIDRTFDVVVANIGAATIGALAPHLVSRLSPRGHLVLSGLLDPPPAEVVAACAPLSLVRVGSVGGWSALTLASADESDGLAPST